MSERKVNMASCEYDTSGMLPKCPSKKRISHITFTTCPGSDLVLRVVKDVNGTVDEYGVKEDSWWCIRTSNLPLRLVRLFKGSRSLHEFLKRYAFLDGKGCVNHKRAVVSYREADAALEPFDIEKCVPKNMLDATGIPQFQPNSGVCWFASTCGVFFSRPDVLDWFGKYMPSEMLNHCRACLFDREEALRLRHMWWYKYNVGDDVDQPPWKDGRNGFSEFTVICAKLGIPLVRYELDGNRLCLMRPTVRDRKGNQCSVKPPSCATDPHLLVFRYIDGNHQEKHPIRRRIVVNGERYRLLGVLSGNRKCGHQIGWVVLDDWRRVMVLDADLHKDGIGPLFICFEGEEWKERWWEGCRDMLHVAKFGEGRREFCNLSPHNPRDDSLDSYRGASEKGNNSLDVCYVRMT